MPAARPKKNHGNSAPIPVFIVHAHHEPKSFNGALTEAAWEALLANGHEVRISDLYAMDFDPISDRRNFKGVGDADYLKYEAEESFATQEGGFAEDIEAEPEKLDWCDVLIFQLPLWWFGLPAILKGWVDRIFAMDRIYGGGRWFDDRYFKGKCAMLSLTTGGGPEPFSEGGITGEINTHFNSIISVSSASSVSTFSRPLSPGPQRASARPARKTISSNMSSASSPSPKRNRSPVAP